MSKGILYGVGVGPGDPELMTLKAIRTLRSADVIGIPVSGRSSTSAERDKASAERNKTSVDRDNTSTGHDSTAFRIACQAVPELAEKDVCRLFFPMTRDSQKRDEAFAENASRLVSYLAEGKSVAFPVLGDPSIYSTYTYVSRLVTAAGYQALMIPGIPSFAAAAAAAGESLGEDDMQIHIIPVLAPSQEAASSPVPRSENPDLAAPCDQPQNPRVGEKFCEQLQNSRDNDEFSDLLRALDLPGRKILMKGGRFTGQLREILSERDMPAILVENCGMEDERIYRSPKDFPDRASYYSIVLL